MNDSNVTTKRRIILIGASVGKAWDFPGLPGRLSDDRYVFEYVGKYQFDKSEVLQEKLDQESNRADAIILKECAAYFPSDISFDQATSLMKTWIDRCLHHKIIPIPTTIVPVTPAHDERFKTHNSVKRLIKKILGISMATRMERIIEYNDWIKEYSAKRELAVLDLELQLRESEERRYLKVEYTKGDGLHLNQQAYAILDANVMPVLDQINFFEK
jgi:hypothetical protein